MDEWNAWRRKCKDDLEDEYKRRGKEAEAKVKAPEEEAKEEIEVWIDEVVEQTEEVVED